jgi:hypothetical protein
MEILSEEHSHTICLPPECIDPKSVKIGKNISYTVHGKVKSVDEKFGVTIELQDKDEPDLEEFENDDEETQNKKIKNQMDSKDALSEY